jgi:hypothetical protein
LFCRYENARIFNINSLPLAFQATKSLTDLHINQIHTKSHYKMKTTFGLTLAVFTISVVQLGAQTYSIDWHKIAGGGGTSTGGVYAVSGTIGQPDASSAMTGGSYSLTGGFWSLYAVQTPGAPLLTITYAGNQAIVSWSPSASGWTLQTNANLATTTWGNYLGTVVNNSITNSPAKGNVFFRLLK